MFRSIRLLVVLVMAIAALLLGSLQLALADPDLPTIPAHRHYIERDGHKVQVGPRVCDNSSLQNAFNRFHSNLHFAVIGSPGPEQSAPGLHDHHDPNIVAGPCA